MTLYLPAYTQPERRERRLRSLRSVTRAQHSGLTPMERWNYEREFGRLLIGDAHYIHDNMSMIRTLFNFLDRGDTTRYEAVLMDMFNISDWPIEAKPELERLAREYTDKRGVERALDWNDPSAWYEGRNLRTDAYAMVNTGLNIVMEHFFARKRANHQPRLKGF